VETTSKLLPAAETERAMKVQEVILKAMAGSLKWWEAAEIIGISDRSLRRWRERYEEFGYDGLFDRRKKRPSPKRVPVKTVEQVLHCIASSTSTSTCGIFTRSWSRTTA